MARKTEDQRLAEIDAKLATLKARAGKLEAVKRSKEKRLEARRAFLVGYAIQSHLEAGGAPIEALAGILDTHVTKTADRLVISDLLQIKGHGAVDPPPSKCA